MHLIAGISWEVDSVLLPPSLYFKNPYNSLNSSSTPYDMSSLSSLLLPATPLSNIHHRHHHPLLLPCDRSFWDKDKQLHFDIRTRCSAISKPRTTEEYTDVFQSGLPVIKWHEIVGDDIQEQVIKLCPPKEIEDRVNTIKAMLGSMDDGEISISAYDTAWVALVQDVHGSGRPQFPSSLAWIANNQLPDGSWGDRLIFFAHDRLINTLACVVALKSWNVYPDKCEKGIRFFKENISKLETENAEHMPIGFEIAFPSLLEIARSLNIDVPDDSPVLPQIYAKRDLKLTRIPEHTLHNKPTTLLHSLEGMPGLDWEKLLKLQCEDGSFLFSPSSTAFAFKETKNQNCLRYLSKTVQRFNGGVPNVYPVDMFEHIWAVDRLQRLGISRYFEADIKECIDYVHRYWTKDGICWARNTPVHDIDDTAMGFRLLRLHGRDVSPEVFEQFKKEGEFVCFAGQSDQAVTGMFNLYRACQVTFPGEKILEDAKQFSCGFLREKQSANELLDKWIIMKDLPGEVSYALEVPWYASLPRVETRFYIDQYGGEDDVWIGKTLYRMPHVSNNHYLELAKLDYNNCQALQNMEWDIFQKWYEECELGRFGMTRRQLLMAYFLAAATIFEPERSRERLAWAKTAVLMETIDAYFTKDKTCSHQSTDFVLQFKNTATSRIYVNTRSWNMNNEVEGLLGRLLETINELSLDAFMAHGRDISHRLHHVWEKWLVKWQMEGDKYQGAAELVVETINLSSGLLVAEEFLSHPQYGQLLDLTNTLCHQLGHWHKHKVQENGSYSTKSSEVESNMQELVRLVLKNSSNGVDSNIKRTFLAVARSFYYNAYFDSGTINYHTAKVLFERIY